MPQQDLTIKAADKMIESTMLINAVSADKKIVNKSSCIHRTENGWCSKSERRCALL